MGGIGMQRSARRRSHVRRWTIAASAAILSGVGVLGAASPALAGLQKEFAKFSDCPVTNPTVSNCVISTTTSGEFVIGSKTVAITSPVVLQGGLTNVSPALVPAADGNTLSKTPLQVPGGLVGIELLPPLTEVSATAELAGTVNMFPSNLALEKGVTASLPLKVKLDNPALGASCYIGSDAEPATPQLTSGTTSPPGPNTPIKGKTGTPEIAGFGKILRVVNSTLVDNAFSVGGANGCAGLLAPVVDLGVDVQAGVPAAAGHNTAVLNGSLEITTPTAVVANAALPEIGRCVKVPSEKVGKITKFHGHYLAAGCVETTPTVNGPWEWLRGPGPKAKFTGTGGATTLETVGKSKLVCSALSSQGEYTGEKTATAAITLTGCKLATGSKEDCQSAGSSPGEIVAPGLSAQLGFIRDEVINEGSELALSVGWDLTHGSSLLAAECGASKEPLTVTGSVIAPISVFNKMAPSNTLKLAQTAGKQAPEGFEEAAPDFPSASFPTKPSEQAGLKSTVKVTNEEQLEVKAQAEELE